MDSIGTDGSTGCSGAREAATAWTLALPIDHPTTTAPTRSTWRGRTSGAGGCLATPISVSSNSPGADASPERGMLPSATSADTAHEPHLGGCAPARVLAMRGGVLT